MVENPATDVIPDAVVSPIPKEVAERCHTVSYPADLHVCASESGAHGMAVLGTDKGDHAACIPIDIVDVEPAKGTTENINATDVYTFKAHVNLEVPAMLIGVVT